MVNNFDEKLDKLVKIVSSQPTSQPKSQDALLQDYLQTRQQVLSPKRRPTAYISTLSPTMMAQQGLPAPIEPPSPTPVPVQEPPVPTPVPAQFSLNDALLNIPDIDRNAIITSYSYYKNLFPQMSDKDLFNMAQNDIQVQKQQLGQAQTALGTAYDTGISALRSALETQATQAMQQYAPALERAYGARGLQQSGIQGEALRRIIENLTGQQATTIAGLEGQKAFDIANLSLQNLANQYNTLNQRLGDIGNVAAQERQNVLSQAMQSAQLGQSAQQFQQSLAEQQRQFNLQQAYNQQLYNYQKQLQEQQQRDAANQQWIQGLLGIGTTLGGIGLMTNPATAPIGAALLGSSYYGGTRGATTTPQPYQVPTYSALSSPNKLSLFYTGQ